MLQVVCNRMELHTAEGLINCKMVKLSEKAFRTLGGTECALHLRRCLCASLLIAPHTHKYDNLNLKDTHGAWVWRGVAVDDFSHRCAKIIEGLALAIIDTSVAGILSYHDVERCEKHCVFKGARRAHG